MKIERLKMFVSIQVNTPETDGIEFVVDKELSPKDLYSLKFKEIFIDELNILSDDFQKKLSQAGFEF